MFIHNLPKAKSTAQKMEFSIKDFFSKSDQIRKKPVDLVTFTEEILNGKIHFLCSGQCFVTSFPLRIFSKNATKSTVFCAVLFAKTGTFSTAQKIKISIKDLVTYI